MKPRGASCLGGPATIQAGAAEHPAGAAEHPPALLPRNQPVSWAALRSVVPDSVEVQRRAARLWSDSGDLTLGHLGVALNTAPRHVELVRTAAVAERIPEVTQIAKQGASALSSTSSSSSS